MRLKPSEIDTVPLDVTSGTKSDCPQLPKTDTSIDNKPLFLNTFSGNSGYL